VCCTCCCCCCGHCCCRLNYGAHIIPEWKLLLLAGWERIVDDIKALLV
jgi:hypothetical protein